MMVPAARPAARQVAAQPLARAEPLACSARRLRQASIVRAGTGLKDLFGQTLARTLGISLAQGEALVSEHGRQDLPVALRALELRQEEAFFAGCLRLRQPLRASGSDPALSRPFHPRSPSAPRATPFANWKMSAIPGFIDHRVDGDCEDAEIPAGRPMRTTNGHRRTRFSRMS